MDKIERLLVFGDIHGKFDRFMEAYQKAGFNSDKDLLVFLGDYLDRGEQPVPVMEWVMENFGKRHMIFLRGNHEQMFYKAVKEKDESTNLLSFLFGSPKALWLNNGGRITYSEIEKTGRKDVLLDNWLKLIEQLPLYTEVEANGKSYWFMHADCNPEVPLAEQEEKTLLWGRSLAMHPELHQGEQVIALGHTPVQALGYEAKPQWLQDGKLVLMDTGSFMENGRVSCADLLSGEVYQSSI
ncbi:putative serine/threonine protein phosphatase [Selenomonas ruminantium subsp. lactilytica TAM6421]|uniref:Putative serine/threonine protein phosphatase n=1 Tax=Selenomonas ruminantium subsp. lactilytica (strain NBRC 103574 / TAM6421) TaxID=927704 RepID=I0GPF8_SELRL|nr:metallophosphoesterase [Selenomonas ruminantium]BAL82645.1 putative serine/threonine protein phosphatase [Selenomonas ruminantium subsp. lactilytica TAM6421]